MATATRWFPPPLQIFGAATISSGIEGKAAAVLEDEDDDEDGDEDDAVEGDGDEKTDDDVRKFRASIGELLKSEKRFLCRHC